MRLLNFYAETGSIHLGLVEGGEVLDLTRIFAGEPGFSSVAGWVRAGDAALRRTAEGLARGRRQSSARRPLEGLRHAPLVDRDCRMFAVGLNYAEHAAENRVPPPDSPVFFAKLAAIVTPHEQPIPLPAASKQVDYEAEFAFMVGRRARRTPEGEASQYIAGFTILNDITARDLQFHDKQWFRGKNCNGFAPLGPWLVTADEVPGADNLNLVLRLNGRVRQQSNTRNLIFKPAALLSFLSQTLTLEAGDVISTGTPGGIGYYAKPQVFLQPGDIVEIEVQGIGTLRNSVVRAGG